MKLNHYKTNEENLAFICGFAYCLGVSCFSRNSRIKKVMHGKENRN